MVVFIRRTKHSGREIVEHLLVIMLNSKSCSESLVLYKILVMKTRQNQLLFSFEVWSKSFYREDYLSFPFPIN